MKIPADDLEVTVHDTQVLFLQNLSAAVEDIECSEQLQKAFKDSVNEGHAGDRVSGEEFSGNPFSSAAMYQSDREALSRYHKLEITKPASAAAAQCATPSSSNKAPAYRPTDDEWESGAAIGFAKPVCL